MRSALSRRRVWVGLKPVTSTVDRDDFSMMKQAIEDGTGCRDIAEQLSPFFDGSIGGHHGRTVFVTAHDDFQEDLATFLRQDFESHIINDEQIGFEVFL